VLAEVVRLDRSAHRSVAGDSDRPDRTSQGRPGRVAQATAKRDQEDIRRRPTPREADMTSSSETGQVTGTKDKDYNLIWFTEVCLSNALRLETYI
jgi:hypothetical protein